MPERVCSPLRLSNHRLEEVRPEGGYVLYWIRHYRRLRFNPALQQAVYWCRELSRPLLVIETFESGHRWDGERHQEFVLDGMRANARQLVQAGITYLPLIDRVEDAVNDVWQLAENACLVITDESPLRESRTEFTSLLERTTAAVQRLDGCGLLPLRATEAAFDTAYAFRRMLQKTVQPWLLDLPKEDPLEDYQGFPHLSLQASGDAIRRTRARLKNSPPIDRILGGTGEARRRLQLFLDERLHRYLERSRPDLCVTSELSPYLRHGMISAAEIFQTLVRHENWNPGRLAPNGRGAKAGWWGMSEPAEAFLDELITWRELGYHFCFHRDDYDRYLSLPNWARATLDAHRIDPRPQIYDRQTLEEARTGDPVWNAAQNELRTRGTIQNYMRMLWGKKILEWTPSPEQALEIMIDLNNLYGLDGCDPNSYSGIFWCLGRFDRAWGERPIFGKVRYMSSESTRRKFNLNSYLEKYGNGPSSL